MAKRVQRRRGDTTENDAFTGALGELTVDTDKDTVVVHDGLLVGGFPLLREDMTNVVPATGRSALSLGNVAVLDATLGTPINGELVYHDDFGAAAFLEPGTNALDLLQFTVPGQLPALDGSLLTGLSDSANITNYSNNHIALLKTMSENNLDVQLIVDGWVDNFETQNAVDIGTSVSETYDNSSPGNSFYHNGLTTPVNPMVLESNSFTAVTEPNVVTITMIWTDVDPATLNTDIIVSVSRDGGTTFTAATMVNRGWFDYPAGPRKILIGTVDVSGQPNGTSIRWRADLSLPTAIERQEIHGVGLLWR